MKLFDGLFLLPVFVVDGFGYDFELFFGLTFFFIAFGDTLELLLDGCHFLLVLG